MKLKEKEKRRKQLEKSDGDQAGKYTKARAAATVKHLTKTGRAALLKVSTRRGWAWGCPLAWDTGSQPVLGGCPNDDLGPAAIVSTLPLNCRDVVTV